MHERRSAAFPRRALALALLAFTGLGVLATLAQPSPARAATHSSAALVRCAPLHASTGTAASAKTNFLWDVNRGFPQITQERNGSNSPQRQYIYGHSRIRQTQGTASYYLYDGLGSVVNLASSTGWVQRTWSYEPFGAIRTQSGTSPTNFLNFAGEYRDPTGLDHLRARQYDPQTGRFLSRDPVPSSGSAYAYVGNAPTSFVDPTGASLSLPGPIVSLCVWCTSSSEGAHTALDVLGVVPVLGEPADAANCLWYAAEGNYVDAALSCGAIVPGLGAGFVAAKWGRRVAQVTTEADEGIVYLRTDTLGSKPYVGQAQSAARYDARQVEHARENPFADFEFSILGRAMPGTELDRLEELFIRQLGGPTTKRNPAGALANRRHQMSDWRYLEAGGAP